MSDLNGTHEPLWFDDIPVLATMSDAEAVAKLIELGEEISVAERSAPVARGTFGFRDFLRRGARNSAHVFGHIDTGVTDARSVPIQHASNIEPDRSLRNAQIKIALGRLNAADYPGTGNHVVLFDFYARHQLAKEGQDLHYNVLVRATQGQRAGVLNQPIFVGLKAGPEGVQLRCLTVNVKNEDDEKLPAFLDSEVFQNGLGSW